MSKTSLCKMQTNDQYHKDEGWITTEQTINNGSGYKTGRKKRMMTCIEQQTTPRQRKSRRYALECEKQKLISKEKSIVFPVITKELRSKPLFLLEKEALIQKIQKRIAYGQKASEEYSKRRKSNVVKLSRYQQNIEKQKVYKQKDYRRLLQTMKKKQTRFIEKPFIDQARFEIQKIKKSRSSLSQKYYKLNKIYHSYQKKDRYGLNEALQLQTTANLALAELYLAHDQLF